MKLPCPLPKTLLATAFVLAVQSRGDVIVDDSFKATLTAGGVVNSVQVDENGRVLIGGSFSQVNGEPRQNLARLLANGSVDSTFAGSAIGNVRTLRLNAAAEILVGGTFSTVNGQTRHNLAKLLVDGGLDTTFGATPGSGGIYSIALGTNDNIVVGGGFQSMNSAPNTYVASLNGLGAIENGFSSGISVCPALETGVYVIATQSDGKILVGGNFNLGETFETLTRLNPNGSIDPTFNGDHGPILYPRVIVPLENGQILIAGTANPFAEGFVRRLNPDGNVDPTFQAPEFFGSVDAILVQLDGRIVVGGSFTRIAGEDWKGLVRLKANGELDPTYKVSVDNVVTSLALQSDGKIIVGGGFSVIGGVARNGIARLKESALSFHSSSNSGGHFVAQLDGEAGKTYVIESSPDLKSWNIFTTNIATEAGLTIMDEAASTQKRRFFRAKLQE